MTKPWTVLLATMTLFASAFAGCSCDPNASMGTDDMPAQVGDGQVGDGQMMMMGDGPMSGDGPIQVRDGGMSISDDGGVFTCYITSCAGKVLECGDCVDNDGDGRTDWRDQECLGPCDNTEGPGLESGVGGTGGNSCGVDCYFDFGNGPGNDNCYWDHRCDPLNPEKNCPYEMNRVGTKECPNMQVPECAKFCMPLTPNGCDCFGCCTFPELAGKGPNGGPGYVWIGNLDDKNMSTCTFAKVQDKMACPPCTPVGNCLNDCGECELCLGKTMLPPHCFGPDGGVPDGAVPDGGIPMRCPMGIQPCGLQNDPLCAQGFFCITGCCEMIIP